jgi:hypothetical protein
MKSVDNQWEKRDEGAQRIEGDRNGLFKRRIEEIGRFKE